MTHKAYLVLEDGTTLAGQAFGHKGEALGETACLTRMSGITEGLADRRTAGQILIHTFPMLGNYGLPKDMENLPLQPAALVVRELCADPSNYRSIGPLDQFFKAQGICVLAGVDTRFLMRHLMKNGPMNALISHGEPAVDDDLLAKIKGHVPSSYIGNVVERLGGEKGPIALIDYGAGEPLARLLQQKGFGVTIIPAGMDDPSIATAKGIILSDGPGSPDHAPALPASLFAVKRPMLALGLGALMLAKSQGGTVTQMHRPHRGANQPVRDHIHGRVLITSQYHGYEVADRPKDAQLTYSNLHGGSIEGLWYPDLSAVAVHFDVFAQDGPHDTGYILADFIHSMGVGACR